MVSGRGAARGTGRQRQVRGPADGVPRLVQLQRDRGPCRKRPGHVASDPAKLQAAYDYLNWMYDGWLGATIMRQGYYIGNGGTLLSWINANGAANPAGGIPFQADEYDFWYNGKPATRDLPGITGKVGDIKKGSVRDGGSFSQRIGHYSSWNSYFTNSTFQIKRWNDFLSA